MSLRLPYHALCAGCLVFGSHVAAAQTYTYTYVSPPGSTQTVPMALGSSGAVLGQWDDSSFATHGFLFYKNVYTEIDYPGAIYTQPTGFNTKGEVVGSYTDKKHFVHSFLYNNGIYETVAMPGANIALLGITKSGTVLGASSEGTGATFFYRNGTFKTIDSTEYDEPLAVNNSLTVVGNAFPPLPAPISAYVISGGVRTAIPINSPISEAVGLNNLSDVVGYQDIGGVIEGFLYRSGHVQTIQVPGSTGTYCEGISDIGAITGYYIDKSFNEIGFVLAGGALTPIAIPGAAGTYGFAINNAGLVLGGYHDASFTQFVFLATPSN